MPSETKQERWWRTRPDPFDGIWEEEILPLLEGEAAGQLRATTIIEWLEEKFPGRFSASQLRTLQRRLQDWRALNGPDQALMLQGSRDFDSLDGYTGFVRKCTTRAPSSNGWSGCVVSGKPA